MSETAQPQYAAVEQPFGCAPVLLHCPICGAATADDGEVTACPHLAFIYVGEARDFVYESDDFAARREKLAVANLGLEDLRPYLAKAGYGNRLLAIEITYGGMACGRVWYTDVVGFDFQAVA